MNGYRKITKVKSGRIYKAPKNATSTMDKPEPKIFSVFLNYLALEYLNVKTFILG